MCGEATSTAGFGYDAAGRLAGTSGVAAAAGATTVGPDGDLATIADTPVRSIGGQVTRVRDVAGVGAVALRYRLYSRLGLDIADITRILTFSLVTNWFGYLLLAGILFMCGAGLLFPVMSGFAKILGAEFNTLQISWARAFGHIVFMLMFFVPRFGLRMLMNSRMIRPQIAR